MLEFITDWVILKRRRSEPWEQEIKVGSASIPAIFVTSASAIQPISGGVQLCTREYLNVLEVAGFSLSLVHYEPDSRFWMRIRRKMFSLPYYGSIPPNLSTQVVTAAQERSAPFVFLNQVDLAPLAASVREHLDEHCKIVLLSHGLRSVDFLHVLRAKGSNDFSGATYGEYAYLGRQLAMECLQRKHIDQVFCLSHFETGVEQWIGAKRVDWVPRTVSAHPLNWTPNSSRLGFVGTLDHPPNKEGLDLFVQALDKQAPMNIRLRVVGAPTDVGKRLATRYSRIDYLGALSDTQLIEEARTWTCFVHPIFCYATGSSTKLATALGWQIPIVTTPAGCRGYQWRQGQIPLAQTPDELASLALQMLDRNTANKSIQEIASILNSSPSLSEIAEKLVHCLSGKSQTISESSPSAVGW